MKAYIVTRGKRERAPYANYRTVTEACSAAWRRGRNRKRTRSKYNQSDIFFFFCCFLLGKTEDSRLHRRLTIPGRRRVGRWIEEKERKAVRVSDKCHTQDGSASEVGWNKCYRERPGIVFFPWSPPSLSPPSLTVVVGRCPVKKGAGQAQFHSTGPVCIQ